VSRKVNFRFNYKHFKENKPLVAASIKARDISDVNLNSVFELYDKIRAEESIVHELKRQRNTLGDSGKIAEVGSPLSSSTSSDSISRRRRSRSRCASTRRMSWTWRAGCRRKQARYRMTFIPTRPSLVYSSDLLHRNRIFVSLFLFYIYIYFLVFYLYIYLLFFLEVEFVLCV
jgi:hypothetical protein